jgi:hypothetical protein
VEKLTKFLLMCQWYWKTSMSAMCSKTLKYALNTVGSTAFMSIIITPDRSKELETEGAREEAMERNNSASQNS